MNKLKILTLCGLVAGFIACNRQNNKKAKDNTSVSTETPEANDYKKIPDNGTHMDPASTTTDWSRYYDTNMDISPMYGNLNMTDQQIKDYETNSKNYRDKWSNKHNMPLDNQAILIHRDSSLQSLLSPEQYRKYQEMRKEKN